MSSPNYVFDLLVIGLHEAEQLGPATPWTYTPQLQRAANQLAVALPTRLPATATGLRKLLNTPLRQWWPAQWPLPPAFEAGCALLDGAQLSEEGYAYYYSELPDTVGVGGEQLHTAALVASDNREFRQLYEELRAKRAESPNLAATVQAEYVRLRRFLIEQPITTGDELTRVFGPSWHVGAGRVGPLYEPCRGPLWHCQHCGPLLTINGQLRGIRPSVCSHHLPGQPTLRQIADAPDLRRIRPGIHWRTCFPGKPELQLYYHIEALQQQYPQLLTEVELWPGLDQYDLRLVFSSGETWAVDVKDWRDPRRLGAGLQPLSSANGLAYTRDFYVVADRWLGTDPEGYLQIVREEARLPASTSIMGLRQFAQLVTTYLRQTAKKSRS